MMSIQSYGQSACRCNEMFGSCEVRCDASQTASCAGTWYGSCKCECLEKLSSTLEPAQFASIDLNSVRLMHEIYESINKDNKLNLAALHKKMYVKAKNGLFIAESQEEYAYYFNQLHNFFNALPLEYKEILNSKIES